MITLKHERFKYTSLQKLLSKTPVEYSIPAHPMPLDSIDTISLTPEGPQGMLPAGISCEAITDISAWPVDTDVHPVARYNLDDSSVITWCVRVAANTRLEKPIHIQHLTDHTADRFVIIGEQGSQFELIESCPPTRQLVNSLIMIDLAANAHCTLYMVQPNMTPHFHISGCHVWQDQASCFKYHSISLGTDMGRYDCHVHLNAEGAQCFAHGGYFLTGKSHQDHHFLVEHKASHTLSDVYYRGIADNQSCGVFNTKAIVHPDCKAIEAYQRNHNLLRSPAAHIYTKPELEIYSDEVKCTHGATVGNLDENALYYLQSRGLSEADASMVLSEHFIQPCFDLISNPHIQQEFSHMLKASVIRHFDEVGTDG